MRFKSLLAVLLWIAASFLLVTKVDIYNHAYALSHPAYNAPVFLRMLGEGKSIVSAISILQADRYFHRGVGHIDTEGCMSGAHSEETEKEELHRHVEGPPTGKFNVLMRIPEEIAVTEHVHLEGDQIKEIIPWLYYAAEIDPHNVGAYTLTGFYLADRLGKTDEALSYLKKGFKNNPGSWEIPAEIGRIYFQYVKDYAASVRFLSLAKVNIDKAPHDKFQERYVLSFLARSYEALGEGKEALPLYERLDELFPGRDYFEKKINSLSGEKI